MALFACMLTRAVARDSGAFHPTQWRLAVVSSSVYLHGVSRLQSLIADPLWSIPGAAFRVCWGSPFLRLPSRHTYVCKWSFTIKQNADQYMVLEVFTGMYFSSVYVCLACAFHVRSSGNGCC